MSAKEELPPDYIGLVAGVRTWRVANTMWARMGGWLWSWGALACWRPPHIEEWKEAECTGGHRIPGENCSCGIYAFHTVAAMQRELGPRDRGDGYEHVSGVIAARGEIVEHEDGFRAQYAKVLAIFSDSLDTPKEEIAEEYHCPIIRPDEYDAFCADHGLIRLDKQ